MRYLDVCAGISASTVAWKPLGWEAAAYSEIEAAPRAVLSHHYPDVPLHGDFTTIQGDEYGAIDLLVGGTPCQDFSVAGLRAGLDGDRGNLSLEFLRLADRTRPRWVVWENVPGVLSIDGGRAFGAILGGLGELGYGSAYRVLDAQHFGVPQRRRRVFVVGCLGDWRGAAAVLSERQSLSGHPAPCREDGAPVAGTFSAGAHPDGLIGQDAYNDLLVTAYQTSGNCGAWETGHITGAIDTGTDPNSVVAAFDLRGREGGSQFEGPHPTVNIRAASGGSSRSYLALALMENQRAELRLSGQTDAISCGGGKPGQGYPAALTVSGVRRLTPREVERCFGFPDDYTLVPYRGKLMADGPRYKALGNSMAVPVMRWIGERIAAVDALSAERSLAA